MRKGMSGTYMIIIAIWLVCTIYLSIIVYLIISGNRISSIILKQILAKKQRTLARSIKEHVLKNFLCSLDFKYCKSSWLKVKYISL